MRLVLGMGHILTLVQMWVIMAWKRCNCGMRKCSERLLDSRPHQSVKCAPVGCKYFVWAVNTIMPLLSLATYCVSAGLGGGAPGAALARRSQLLARVSV